jgi:hypothetical protein
MLYPGRGAVTNLQFSCIKEFFPIASQVGKFNLQNPPSSLITLCESPAKVVSKLEMAQVSLPMNVMSHRLTRLEPGWMPGMNGVALGRVHIRKGGRIIQFSNIDEVTSTEGSCGSIWELNVIPVIPRAGKGLDNTIGTWGFAI